MGVSVKTKGVNDASSLSYREKLIREYNEYGAELDCLWRAARFGDRCENCDQPLGTMSGAVESERIEWLLDRLYNIVLDLETLNGIESDSGPSGDT